MSALLGDAPEGVSGEGILAGDRPAALTDALQRGSAPGIVSRLDLSAIDTSLLTDRIASAEEYREMLSISL